VPESARPNPLRRLYDWVLSWAKTPYGTWALFALAFMESSFFPIPPDVLLIALCVGAPNRAFTFAAVCTAGSVLGGLFGYYIGYGLWSVFEPWLLGPVLPREDFAAVTEKYREYGGVAVFAAAFTPIPYKVFTVAAGVSHLALAPFILASLAGRGGRFFLVGAVVRLFGDRARELIDRYFNLLTIVGAILLIGGFLLVRAMG